ncbi:MAG: ATP-binding cassette domain-containing protein, partial [Ignisphaera sp.]
MMYAVEIENLNLYIDGRHILKNISMNVSYNTIHVIMGPSGSGKTTLLRTINRLIDLVPNARITGRIAVLGRDVLSSDPYILRRDIGMVFQIPNPFPHMTIYENVAISARLNGIARSRR